MLGQVGVQVERDALRAGLDLDVRQVWQRLVEQDLDGVDLGGRQGYLALNVAHEPIDELAGLDLGPDVVLVRLTQSSCHINLYVAVGGMAAIVTGDLKRQSPLGRGLHRRDHQALEESLGAVQTHAADVSLHLPLGGQLAKTRIAPALHSLCGSQHTTLVATWHGPCVFTIENHTGYPLVLMVIHSGYPLENRLSILVR